VNDYRTAVECSTLLNINCCVFNYVDVCHCGSSILHSQLLNCVQLQPESFSQAAFYPISFLSGCFVNIRCAFIKALNLLISPTSCIFILFISLKLINTSNTSFYKVVTMTRPSCLRTCYLVFVHPIAALAHFRSCFLDHRRHACCY